MNDQDLIYEQYKVMRRSENNNSILKAILFVIALILLLAWLG